MYATKTKMLWWSNDPFLSDLITRNKPRRNFIMFVHVALSSLRLYMHATTPIYFLSHTTQVT